MAKQPKRNDNSSKANKAWSEVQASTDVDLKTLVNDISIALAKKKEQERARVQTYKPRIKVDKRIGKKDLKQKIQLVTKAAVKEVERTKAISNAYERIADLEDMTIGSRIEAEMALREFQSNLDKALAAPSNVSQLVVNQLESEYGRVSAFVRDGKFGPADAIHDRVTLAFDSLIQLKTIAKSNEEEGRRRRIERLNIAKVAFFNKTLAIKDRVSSGVESWVIKQIKAESAPTTSSQVVTARPEKTRMASQIVPDSAMGGKVVKTPVSRAKQVLAVQPDVKPRDQMGSTLKWVKKQLASVSSSLWRIVKAPFKMVSESGTDWLNSIITVAAASQFMVPFLEGINRALEEKFGERYITDFIKGVWGNSWSWMVKQIRSLLGIQEQTPAEQSRETARKQLEQTTQNPQSTPSQILNSKLNFFNQQSEVASEAKNANQASSANRKKMEAKTNIQNDITYAPDGSIDKETANKLTSAGFKVPPEKVGVNLPIPAVTAGGGRGVQGGPTLEQATTASPVVSSPSAAPTQPTARPAPMEMPSIEKPVIAPQPPAKETTEETRSEAQPSGSYSALGVTQVPTFLSPDSLHLFNSGVLTA